MSYNYKKLFGNREIVIFDIDGTLVSTIPLHIDCSREAIRKVTGLNVKKDEEITRHFGKTATMCISGILHDQGINPESKIVKKILKVWK